MHLVSYRYDALTRRFSQRNTAQPFHPSDHTFPHAWNSVRVSKSAKPIPCTFQEPTTCTGVFSIPGRSKSHSCVSTGRLHSTWTDTRPILRDPKSSSSATCNSPLRYPMTARLRYPFWTRMSRNASFASWTSISFLFCGSFSCWPSSTARTCVSYHLSLSLRMY